MIEITEKVAYVGQVLGICQNDQDWIVDSSLLLDQNRM